MIESVVMPALEHGLKVAGGIAWFAVFLATAILVRLGARSVLAKLRFTPAVVTLSTEVGFFMILAVGVASSMNRMGVPIGGVVAGLGLGTFVVGFALRDAMGNMLAGFLTLLYRPFTVGDKLTVAGLTGEVIEVNLRYTVLQSDDKRHLIPNQMVFNNPVQIHREPEKTEGQAE